MKNVNGILPMGTVFSFLCWECGAEVVNGENGMYWHCAKPGAPCKNDDKIFIIPKQMIDLKAFDSFEEAARYKEPTASERNALCQEALKELDAREKNKHN